MQADQEDLYGSEPAAPAPAPVEQNPEQEESDGAETSILPKTFFQGKDLTPGKRCEVEVVRVGESDVEVKYISHASEPEPGADESAMSSDMMSEYS